MAGLQQGGLQPPSPSHLCPVSPAGPASCGVHSQHPTGHIPGPHPAPFTAQTPLHLFALSIHTPPHAAHPGVPTGGGGVSRCLQGAHGGVPAAGGEALPRRCRCTTGLVCTVCVCACAREPPGAAALRVRACVCVRAAPGAPRGRQLGAPPPSIPSHRHRYRAAGGGRRPGKGWGGGGKPRRDRGGSGR